MAIKFLNLGITTILSYEMLFKFDFSFWLNKDKIKKKKGGDHSTGGACMIGNPTPLYYLNQIIAYGLCIG